MAKAEFIYRFDIPEETQDMKHFLSAQNAMSVLWDVDQELRNKLKHGDPEWLRNEDASAYLEHLRDMIWSQGVFEDEF